MAYDGIAPGRPSIPACFGEAPAGSSCIIRTLCLHSSDARRPPGKILEIQVIVKTKNWTKPSLKTFQGSKDSRPIMSLIFVSSVHFAGTTQRTRHANLPDKGTRGLSYPMPSNTTGVSESPHVTGPPGRGSSPRIRTCQRSREPAKESMREREMQQVQNTLALPNSSWNYMELTYDEI